MSVLSSGSGFIILGDLASGADELVLALVTVSCFLILGLVLGDEAGDLPFFSSCPTLNLLLIILVGCWLSEFMGPQLLLAECYISDKNFH